MMISVVVPLFNEQESIQVFYDKLVVELEKLKKSYEIIFIDDGSTDNSLQHIQEIAQKNKNVRIFSFRRNYGKAEALSVGFARARGDYIITLDADLQDQPSEIKKLLDKIDEGWDLVCGWRKDRKDSFQKIISSKFFNFIAKVLWGLRLHDYNCGLKAYRKDAVKDLNLYGGLHRFIPIILFQQGFSVTEVVVSHRKRLYGKSKFGFSKLWRDFPDMLTMFFLTRYSSRPSHFFTVVGGAILLLGLGILTYLGIVWLQGHSIGTRPLLTFGMLFVLTGFQILFTGFLADLIINISHTSSGGVNKSKNFIFKYERDSIK